VWEGVSSSKGDWLTGDLPDDQGAEQRIGQEEEWGDEDREDMAAVEDVENEAGYTGVNWRLVVFSHGCRRRLGDDAGDGVEDALRIGAWSLELESHGSLGCRSWRVAASAMFYPGS
jgi:hypothetical protein